MNWFASGQQPGGQPQPPLPSQRIAYIWAVISEIRMLIDYVAGSSTHTLADLKIADKEGKFQAPSAVLEQIDKMEQILSTKDAVIEPGMLATVQTVRDAMGQLVRPASGLTIAYTALVTGNRRGNNSDSRASMAERAYFGLVPSAKCHRWWQNTILVFTLIIMVVTVWESAKVALGKSLLQNLDFLRPQQASLYAEKTKLEVALDKADTQNRSSSWTNVNQVPLTAYSLCDRPMVLMFNLTSAIKNGKDPLILYGSPQERDVCERDRILRTNFEIVHQDLNAYLRDWPAMVGMLFRLFKNAIDFSLCHSLWAIMCHSDGISQLKPGLDDVEFMVAPVLLVWGNYILPILFSFLGTTIYVILDHSNKVRDSLLHPKDRFLSAVRLVLGIVTGASIGLFFSSYGPTQQAGSTPSAGALISSLTLTASGVAFLAGFGVEGVFTMLEATVSRVFAVQQAPK